MKITNFAKLVTQHEALKKQVNIAQMMEILKVLNKLTNGVMYAMIKAIK